MWFQWYHVLVVMMMTMTMKKYVVSLFTAHDGITT